MAVNWELAKCEKFPGVDFFPSEKETKKIRAAKAICRGCPIRFECLEENMNIPDGIFGGTTGSERSFTRLLLTATSSSLGGLSDTLNQSALSAPHIPNDTQDKPKTIVSPSVPVLFPTAGQSIRLVFDTRLPLTG